MKRVIATPAGAELEVLRNMLQQAGIPCVIRNEALAGLLGTTPFNAELWVERDEDCEKAQGLYKAWCEPVTETVQIWTCVTCGQQLDVQFDSCWQCGAQRPACAVASGAEPALPDSWDEALHRAEEMTSVLDEILHLPDQPA
jgi:hypothetical protein